MASSLRNYRLFVSPAISDSDLPIPGKLGTTDHRRGGDTQRTLSAADAPIRLSASQVKIHDD